MLSAKKNFLVLIRHILWKLLLGGGWRPGDPAVGHPSSPNVPNTAMSNVYLNYLLLSHSCFHVFSTYLHNRSHAETDG